MTGFHPGVAHGHRVARRVIASAIRHEVSLSLSLRGTDYYVVTGRLRRTRARVNKRSPCEEHDEKTSRRGATRRIYRTNRHVNVPIGMSP